jgi:hypothetical protein
MLCIVFPTILYTDVVLIDPFSTGRFGLSHRIDFASRNTRLVYAGLVRDAGFDGAIFGSSTAVPLDPEKIAVGTAWRFAHLSILAALPQNQLTVARAFARYHSKMPTLQVFVLDELWCKVREPMPYGPFPSWIYERSDSVYLSRIFFADAVEAAAMRIAIWSGAAKQAMRADGYMPDYFRDRRAEILALQRPTIDAAPDAPFPALDALEDHLAELPMATRIGLVFAPMFLNALPADGSLAAKRHDACKERVQQLAGRRPGTGYLDLLKENAITRDVANFRDAVHVSPEGARLIEIEMNRLIRSNMPIR